MDVDTRCFPLSYNLGKVEGGLEPDPSVSCDSPVCHVSNMQDIQVLACFHSFHLSCLPADGFCRICDGPLQKIAKELSESFNKGLLSGQDEETEEDSPSNDDENTSEMEVPAADEAENYYNSPAWDRKISEQIENFVNITHPTKPNRQSHTQPSNATTQPTHNPSQNTQSRQTTTEESSAPTHHPSQNTHSRQATTEESSHLPTLNLFIPATSHQKFTTWHFPRRLSQSTIGGRNGSKDVPS